MTREEILKLLKTKKYDFLRTDPHLGNNIILLVVGGSHSYGTNVETSDVDIRGVAMNSFTDLIGTTNFEQREDKETDTVIYGFKKFIHLASNCNPNIIEMLFVEPEHVLYANELGKLLLENRYLFLSQKAEYTFGGYAHSQLNRLNNALVRNGKILTPKETQEQINRSITNAVRSFENRFNVKEGDLKTYVDLDEDSNYDIFIDFNLKGTKLGQLVEMMEQLSNIKRDYQKTVGPKNKKKDNIHLNKHMMHLIRLYYMACEILEDGNLHTFRKEEHDMLMAIRNGAYRTPTGRVKKSFYTLLNSLEERLMEAKKTTGLPRAVNKKLISDFMTDVFKKANIVNV